jgi:two-component system, OmpR family, sensor histidine kinase KdpD
MLDKAIHVPAAVRNWRRMVDLARSEWSAVHVAPIVISLAIVAGVTVLLLVAGPLVDLDHAAFGYLIPVIIAATRWGVTPAIVSGLAGLAASAFFFYPPIYDIRVYNPAHVADLLLFVVVAVVTGQLANRVRKHVKVARQREEEMKALYFFSRRLAVASGPADIHAAIQDHISAITGCRVALFAGGVGHSRPEASSQWPEMPDAIQRAIVEVFDCRSHGHEAPLLDRKTGASWLIRILLQRNALVGIKAIELGRVSRQSIDAIRRRVDTALTEAAATLERIDVAHALGEARIRSEAETLREALIGSVSHELRTPLASILGSTSVLSQAPGVAQDARLSSLVEVIRDETERLSSDIQNLLDASRISSAGLQAHFAWTEPSDIVNAALTRLHRRLEAHHLDSRLAGDLPLVHIDEVLVEQALSQIIDNAAKYAPPGSTITIDAREVNGTVEIAVSDQGPGLTGEEHLRLFERFYRGPRHQAAVKGSGLGLWIARAFIMASGGRLEASSKGAERGTTLTIVLPAPPLAHGDPLENRDE